MLALTPLMKIAIFSYGCFVTGFFLRQRRKWHASFMISGILMDFLIVGKLVLQRQVLNTALSVSLTWPQQGHIIASLIAVLLYFPILALGILLLLGRGGPGLRSWHVRLGITAFAFRSLGLILMFSMPERYS